MQPNIYPHSRQIKMWLFGWHAGLVPTLAVQHRAFGGLMWIFDQTYYRSEVQKSNGTALDYPGRLLSPQLNRFNYEPQYLIAESLIPWPNIERLRHYIRRLHLTWTTASLLHFLSQQPVPPDPVNKRSGISCFMSCLTRAESSSIYQTPSRQSRSHLDRRSPPELRSASNYALFFDHAHPLTHALSLTKVIRIVDHTRVWADATSY